MPTLFSKLEATHTSSIQGTAEFKTRIIPPSSVVVEITLRRTDPKAMFNKEIHNDFVLDTQTPSHNITMDANGVVLNGDLKGNLNEKFVVFEGNLNFPGQFSVFLSPVIVALYS